ncbi:MAG: alpha/beta hydrolase [Sedimentitalea sp.]|uniref:alpha/beta fold hydrolase n=1 Tax=Sedimentitalea sp. TaxID=2048915 RepID=UPI003266259C
MQDVKTVEVPHLCSSKIGYRFGANYDASKPTLIMVNSFATSSQLYRPQYADKDLMDTANLLAFELFGHGETRSNSPQFTYWDSAIANLQAMDKLGIDKAFVLGTSQGGWVAARMALLAPDRILGIIPLGTSMDYESAQSQELGCWDGAAFNSPLVDALAQTVSSDWDPGPDFCEALLAAGFGPDVSDEERAFWHKTLRANYKGDEGRRRLRMCAINLRDRDGLYGRLDYIICPVLWIHGTADQVYSVKNAETGIAKFVNSKDSSLSVVEDGQHFLSASHPQEVNAQTRAFIKTHG